MRQKFFDTNYLKCSNNFAADCKFSVLFFVKVINLQSKSFWSLVIVLFEDKAGDNTCKHFEFHFTFIIDSAKDATPFSTSFLIGPESGVLTRFDCI